MSGGTPTAGGGFVRQRFSQGYSSSGEDFEDDACSRTPMELSLPLVQRARTWAEVLKNLVWAVSAVFIVYYGDGDANMISLLWSDERIRSSGFKGVAGYMGVQKKGYKTISKQLAQRYKEILRTT